MKKIMKPATIMLAITLSSMTIIPATASENERVPRVTDKLVQKECGACHMTFQPAFLPAKSWQKIMGDLKNHFGEDASLKQETLKKVEEYMVKNAGRKRWLSGWSKTPIRITELGWFKREHWREVSARSRKKAGTMSNCKSCHTTADYGNYDDD